MNEFKTFSNAPIDGSNPVNPIKTYYDDGSSIETFGLSIRAHFAAIAMQGLLANTSLNNSDQYSTTSIYQAISDLSVAHADALIEALNKEAKS